VRALPAPARPTAHGRRGGGYANSHDTRARILAAALDETSRAGLRKAAVAGIAARGIPAA
jgi:AcrR family transcriptional regulator